MTFFAPKYGNLNKVATVFSHSKLSGLKRPSDDKALLKKQPFDPGMKDIDLAVPEIFQFIFRRGGLL
jgi:hypothetical protein